MLNDTPNTLFSGLRSIRRERSEDTLLRCVPIHSVNPAGRHCPVHILVPAILLKMAIGVDCNLRMSSSSRYSSSVYSDSFDLEGFLQRLSEQASQQQIRTIQTLIDENRNLQNELRKMHSIWKSIYCHTEDVNSIGGQLRKIKN